MDKKLTLLEKLRSLDAQRVPFFEAQKKLHEQGYNEQEVAYALYSFSYDGKPNAPRHHDPVASYYAASPKEAERIAKYILDNAKRSGYGNRAAYYLASQYAPGPQARARYALKFADEIGYPYFTALFSILPSFLVTEAYDLPNRAIYAGPVLVTLYWLLKKLWQRFR